MKRQDRVLTARASRHRFFTSRGAVPIFVAFMVLFGTASCTKAPAKPPESALKHANKDTPSPELEETDLERRYLAPPPAYGNKVVMAKHEDAPTQEF